MEIGRKMNEREKGRKEDRKKEGRREGGSKGRRKGKGKKEGTLVLGGMENLIMLPSICFLFLRKCVPARRKKYSGVVLIDR